MCWWAAVAQVGLQAMGMYQQYSSQAKYLEAQATGAIKEMNYAFQNYEIERQDAYDSAVNDIIKTRINQLQLNSQVNAAIAEGYAGGGRTANRLKRAAEADTSRTVASIQDNYTRKSNEVDLNKESALISTNDTLENLKKQGKISKWQKFSDIAQLSATAISGYNEYKTQAQAAKNAGGSFNFWGSHSAKNVAGSSSSGYTIGSSSFGSTYNYDLSNYGTWASKNASRIKIK